MAISFTKLKLIFGLEFEWTNVSRSSLYDLIGHAYLCERMRLFMFCALYSILQFTSLTLT